MSDGVTTEAGRALTAILPGPDEHGNGIAWERRIAAIEGEAVEKYRQMLREAVKKMRELVPKIDAPHAHIRIATLDAVLALLAPPAEGEQT